MDFSANASKRCTAQCKPELPGKQHARKPRFQVQERFWSARTLRLPERVEADVVAAEEV